MVPNVVDIPEEIQVNDVIKMHGALIKESQGKKILIFRKPPIRICGQKKAIGDPIDYSTASAKGNLQKALSEHTIIEDEDSLDEFADLNIDSSLNELTPEEKGIVKPKRTSSGEDFTPIKSLNTVNQDWMLKVRLVKK